MIGGGASRCRLDEREIDRISRKAHFRHWPAGLGQNVSCHFAKPILMRKSSASITGRACAALRLARAKLMARENMPGSYGQRHVGRGLIHLSGSAISNWGKSTMFPA